MEDRTPVLKEGGDSQEVNTPVHMLPVCVPSLDSVPERQQDMQRQHQDSSSTSVGAGGLLGSSQWEI